MSETKKHYKDINDRYYVGNNGELYYVEPIVKDGEVTGQSETAIANHSPILKEHTSIYDGIERIERLVFTVRRKYQNSEDIIVTPDDILSRTPTLKFGAACRIYLGRAYKARYVEAMQIQCENLPEITVYRHSGYEIIGGKRVFLNGGYSVTAEGLTDKYRVSFEQDLGDFRFLAERHEDRFKTLLELLPACASKHIVLSGLGLTFLTPLNALLREVGLEPRFILYFTGKTGIGKTTMSKMFVNFFGTFKNGGTANTICRDSSNSVEKVFALTDSTLVLLDDLIPSTSAKVKDKMDEIEQSVARQIGDRTGRKRMNADGSLKGAYIPKCNVILTAEQSYSNVGESAIARSISADIEPEDLDVDKVFEVQQRAYHFNECMGDYIQYVIQNWEELQKELEPLFYEYRKKAQTGGHKRLAENVAHLQIGIYTMCKWLRSINQLSQEKSDEMLVESWTVFMKLAERQNYRITEETPVKLFLNAIKELRDRGVIRFVTQGQDSINTETRSVMGYKDDNYYYCYPDAIYSEVRKFYDKQGMTFPLARTAMFKYLAQDKIIETDKDQNTKAKRLENKRPRFLWIKAEVLDKEEDTD